ncbi:HAMP domain-containing sensor histidine kinase [Clostridium algidicarnis]|uniref:histidine kinase n=1 Tax=Clostridium algidicarnis DSM 15099 TaxID=1121295 RepID=A0A2S6G0D9_9CLOT|nr:ATP-binding protein [Clostridium algidicarnis]PPK49394.1 HAMP domain-containing protein [Clostridium algidicarnis DSM 15099]
MSDKFNYNIKIKEPFNKTKKFKYDDEHLIYKNLRSETKEYGVIYIQIIKDMDNEYDFMKILFVFMLISDFIGIIASIIVGYFVSKRMLRPIDHIIKAADNISINNLKERIEITGPNDELKRLGDTENQRIEKKEFLLNELIYEVVTETNLIDKNHTISSEKNNNVSIFADYKMIKQMVRIFVDNSIKFTPAQGNIDISLETKDKRVKIIISDSGIGIPKDEIQNIFERFYTADKSRSKDIAGTGLGLSIAKWIIDVHKGEVNVQSEEGKGTQVTVILETL